MNYKPLNKIELTQTEFKLYSKIFNKMQDDHWEEIADSMEKLLKSLRKRNAIPEIRLRIFADSTYAETRNKSPKQIFESNGTTGNDIFRHPHFKPYLEYFINGPNLPQQVIQGLCKILNDDQGTSGEVLNQYRKYARQCVRHYNLESAKAATEFFRLGLEIGMELYDARTLRNAVKSTR